MDYGPRRIDQGLLRMVAKLPPPASPKEIRDKEQGMVLRHQPGTGAIKLYAVAGRGQRKIICDARAILDRTRPETLRWAATEARKFRGKAALGELEPAQRGAPTLEKFLVGPCRRPYKEVKAAIEIQRLLSAFGDLLSRPLDKIEPLDITRYAKASVKAGAASESIKRNVRVLHAALNKAVEWKLISVNPIKGAVKGKKRRTTVADIQLAPTKARVRYLSDDEEQRLRDALRDRDAHKRQGRGSANQWRADRGKVLKPDFRPYTDYLEPAVLVAMKTAMRRGEQFALTWGDINFDTRQISLAANITKSGEDRYIPMSDEVHKVLAKWKPMDAKPDDLVFATPAGAPIMSSKTAWASLMKAASITDFRWHDLRHHAASKMVMSGASLYVVCKILGHADVSTTQRYAHLAPGHLADAVALLG